MLNCWSYGNLFRFQYIKAFSAPGQILGWPAPHSKSKRKVMILKALAQIPISTFSHIWVLVRQYGIMFVIIVILIIIIIIIQKSKSINTEACLIAHWLKLRYGLMMQAILGHAGDFITVWKKEKSTRPHGNPLCFPKNIFCLMWCNWKRMAVLESA